MQINFHPKKFVFDTFFDIFVFEKAGALYYMFIVKTIIFIWKDFLQATAPDKSIQSVL